MFCWIKLKWDYDKKTIDISMPNYVIKAIARLHYSPPIKPQHYPYPYNDPVYYQKRQFFVPTITNKYWTPSQLKHCEEFCGFSIIMPDPLTTPWKQPSVPSPPPFQPDHGRISNFKSIHLFTIQTLKLMPKFDIKQNKYTYGFTQTPLISMNLKLTLAMVSFYIY